MSVNPVLVIDRRSQELINEPVMMPFVMRCLFSGNHSHRWSLTSFLAHATLINRLTGCIMRHRFSRHWIDNFIEVHHVRSIEFEQPLEGWNSFEAFFSRRLRPGMRQIAQEPRTAVAPADGRYSFFDPLDSQTNLWIKGRAYNMKTLLGDRLEHYQLAPVALARLCSSDYHRFHSPINGTIRQIQASPGPLFSVHPWSLQQNFGRLLENKRVLIEIEHETLGSCLIIAIGATNIGSLEISVELGQQVVKGEEIGAFHFGGSALLIVMQPGVWDWADDLLALFERHEGKYEIFAQMGQPLSNRIQGSHERE